MLVTLNQNWIRSIRVKALYIFIIIYKIVIALQTDSQRSVIINQSMRFMNDYGQSNLYSKFFTRIMKLNI
jgi:hypothetical protein